MLGRLSFDENETFIAHMEDIRQTVLADMSTLPGNIGPEYQAAGHCVQMEGKLLNQCIV